ncbi:hypothetical protein JCM8208_002779 [Rhodotorula glutinis]
MISAASFSSTSMATTPVLDLQHKSGRDDERDFVLEGVFIHPDHLAQGFFADEPVDSCSETSSIVDYNDELPVAELTGLALNCGSAQDETHDYFAPRAGSSNPSPFYSGSTESSQASSLLERDGPGAWSAASTPTCDALVKPDFSRRSSMYSVSDAASPCIPATFSYASFHVPATASAPMTRLPSRSTSPTRPSPYSRPSSSSSHGGASMTRSVSSPVETQRQVEDRQRRISIAEVVMDERAVKMARSQSTATTPVLGAFPSHLTGSASMGRTSSKPLFSPLMASASMGRTSSKPLFSPLMASSSSSSTGWANLPGASPFLASRPGAAPLRNERAHSHAGVENYFPPPSALAEPRRSVPTIPFAAAPASTSASRQSRRISRIFPLTPILPQSPELAAEPSCAVQATAASSSFDSQPLARGRLHRGMTF